MKIDNAIIKEIKKLKVENGDMLIIKTEDRVPIKIANALHHKIKDILDKNVLVVIIQKDYKLEKMKYDDAIMLLNKLIELKEKN